MIESGVVILVLLVILKWVDYLGKAKALKAHRLTDPTPRSKRRPRRR